MNEWITRQADALGAGEQTDAEQATLLDLARVAAHDSGDRTNAPLLCYLLGRTQGEKSLDELAEIVRSTS